VRVTASGHKAYVVQGRVGHKTRRVTIGDVANRGLDDARARATKLLAQMEDGVDPVAERKRKEADAAQSVTLREVMQDYLNRHTPHGPLRPATKHNIERYVTKEFAAWADRPITDIDRDACIKRFRELSKHAPGSANLGFRILSALINYVRERHVTPKGEYTIFQVNPVVSMYKSRDVARNEEEPRTRRIPVAKLPAVWSLLQRERDSDNFGSADLVAFLLLTGARLGEGSGLRWPHVDLTGEVPSFTLTETKSHRNVTIPLSAPLLALLRDRYARRARRSPYVFPSGDGHLRSPRSMLDKVGVVAGLRVSAHDLRRTYVTAAHSADIEMWRVELLTNHKPATITAKHYAQNQDLRYLLPDVERIARFITSGSLSPSAL
jgi:integrase